MQIFILFISDLRLAFKNLWLRIIKEFYRRLPAKYGCKLATFFSPKGVVFVNGEQSYYKIASDSNEWYFSSLLRGIATYQKGLVYRSDEFFASYLMQNIDFTHLDFVLDCGANWGDCFLMMETRGIRIKYIGIEPSPRDYHCLKKNTKGKCLQVGLGKVTGKLPFYLKEDSADSSFVFFGSEHSIDIDVIQGRDLVEKYKIKSGLLKVEAEGFEPEVLEGFGDSIKQFLYIALDGGHERGVEQSSTITDAINYLLKNGFKLVDLNLDNTFNGKTLPRGRALFIRE